MRLHGSDYEVPSCHEQPAHGDGWAKPTSHAARADRTTALEGYTEVVGAIQLALENGRLHLAGLSGASRHSLLMAPARAVIVRPLEDYVRMVGGAPMSAARRKVDLNAVAEWVSSASNSGTRPSVWPNSWRRRAGRS